MTLMQVPVTDIPGVGEETAKDLHRLKIDTIEDLILNFPYRYENYQIKNLENVGHDELVTVMGKVHSEPSLRYFGRKKSRLSFRAYVDAILINVVIFNRAFLKNKFSIGDTVTIIGKWDQHRLAITAQEIYKGEEKNHRDIEPVYSVGGKLNVKKMRKLVTNALDNYSTLLNDPLPDQLRSTYKLPTRIEAIKELHFPTSAQHLKHARRRMVYEEFLLFHLKMQALKKFKRGTDETDYIQIPVPVDQVKGFIAQLPFQLTGAQERVTEEILRDLSRPYHMNRLLQGDVGSGKTVVAAIALYAVSQAGYQGALMVPTEILAEQHAESLLGLLGEHNMTVALLTSNVKGRARKELLQQLKNGSIDVIVGTHALIQDEVDFHHLGLVITDEQHRFGVVQRRVLRDKGGDPDVLYMTATPIPRTLAITAYGDMDVSTIDELPAGRKPIETYWIRPNQLERVLTFIKREIDQGRQAYVICPLIEESEQLDVQNAIDVHADLTAYFDQCHVALMHGRLANDEKDQVMEDFKEKKSDILVSTTVVEVGVDVPNATMMVIFDAQRFGLAQLHQLRGRVGRGSHQSYCILVADVKSEVGKERMRIMSETNDGFQLSEHDLKLRGPGDFFGAKQSGVPEFVLGDITHDYKALETARQDAEKMILSEGFWQNEQYKDLRDFLSDMGVMDAIKLD